MGSLSIAEQFSGLTPQQSIEKFISLIQPIQHKLPPELQQQAARIISIGTKQTVLEACRKDFLTYIKYMWVALGIPAAYREGVHHRMMADAFNRIAEGKLRRLILSMPPRSGKSIFASEALPTWFLGKFPSKFVIQVSNGKRLAAKFGAKVRDTFDSEEFQSIFPGVRLSKSTKGKEVFNTNKKGRYVALSMEAKKAGEGGHLIIVDDPHSEEDVVKMISKPAIWEDAQQRFLGIRQRSQTKAAIILIATRWNSRDIIGQALKTMERGGEEWEHINFPAIIDEDLPTQRSFWEEGKPLEELLIEKAATPLWKWMAVYQQKPMDEGANIIPRETWKPWTKIHENGSNYGKPLYPPFMYKIQAWDTAQSSKDVANFSACTTWGVFYATEDDKSIGQKSIMVIDGCQGRWDLTELRDKAVMMYNRHNPDVLIIESKQSGTGLISILREFGIHAEPFIPSRGTFKVPNDKLARLNSISDVFKSGCVYAPLDEPWAQDVKESCATAGFGGTHDDYADTVTMSLLRLRQSKYVLLPEEIKARRESEKALAQRPKRAEDSSPIGYW